MKRILLAPLALLAALLVATASGAATTTVQITANGFVPKATTINVGDTVTWHNADTSAHQVVANNGSFASPVLKPDETWSHTFTSAAKLGYRDSQATSHTGSVTVKGPTPDVSLSSNRSKITYGSGQEATLSGTVNSGTAGEQVTLTSLAYGQTAAQAGSTTKTTTTNGAFEFSVSPSIQTVYQVKWKSATSAPVTVNVAPRVGFGRIGRLYRAKVTSELTYRGHFVWVQRHTAFGWRNMKQVVLRSGSQAVFGLKLRHGRNLLRLFLPSAQAGAGYVAGTSSMLAIRR